MRLKALILRSFRNYTQLELPFSNGKNLITGDNGAGKTNILEALYLLSYGRSFRTVQLTDLIQEGATSFYAAVYFETMGIEQCIKISFDGKQRQVEHNRAKTSSFIDLLGTFPSVLFSPKDIAFIMGAPLERRRFFNLHLSQINSNYVCHLIRYNRALKQRNKLLKQFNLNTLNIWEYEMAKSTLILTKTRESIAKSLAQYFQKPLPWPLSLCLSYSPSIYGEDVRQVVEQYLTGRERDIKAKTSLTGPHRDDFMLTLNNKDAKQFASEGQKRAFLAALKLSEWQSLKEHLQTNPLLCVDDYTTHLDAARVQAMESAIESIPQTVLTTPVLPTEIATNNHIHIENGKIASSTACAR